MRGKVSIIKKVFILQLFTVFMLTLSAEPYKPYPILFIHGIGATSEGCWGAGVDTLANGQLSDWVTYWESTYDHFLDIMQPYILADTFFIQPEQADYPNRDLLEVINGTILLVRI